MADKRSIARKVKRIKMLLLDVDGVLTDGGIYYSATGAEMKRFHAHDGYGVVRAREHGLKLGIISGRQTPIVDVRAKELQIEDVIQNAQDKVAAMEELGRKHNLRPDEMAFIGDDLFDIPLLKVVGFSAAPADAFLRVKNVVDFVTRARGGNGAARELIDFMIERQRK